VGELLGGGDHSCCSGVVVEDMGPKVATAQSTADMVQLPAQCWTQCSSLTCRGLTKEYQCIRSQTFSQVPEPMALPSLAKGAALRACAEQRRQGGLPYSDQQEETAG
jgi:hypothetical protein